MLQLGEEKKPTKYRAKMNYKNVTSGVSVFIPMLKTITLWQIFKFCVFDRINRNKKINLHVSQGKISMKGNKLIFLMQNWMCT